MQADEYSQAISFANGYFALVDGLAYGLEDYLVEDVRLEWFGRVFKGRKNVAAFIRNHMANSRHMFAEIMPIANFDSGSCKVPRRKYKSEGSLADTTGNITDNIVQSDLSFSSLQIEDEAANVKEEMNFDLNDFTPYRSGVATKAEKIEKFHVPDKNPSVFDIKFIESKGIVEFDRRFAPNKIRKWGPIGFNSGQTAHQWRRRCILKIAYSTRFKLSTKSEENLTKSDIFAVENNAPVPMDCEENLKRQNSNTSQRRKRLKSSDDVLGSIAGFEANFNSFEDFDCINEKKRFLECFETEIAAGNSKFDLKTPKYIGNRLVFNSTEKINSDCREYSKSFKFDYLIHTIVYESNIECKLNLSEEFEKQEIVELGEIEKRV